MAAADGGLGGEADALAIPGIGGEIDDAHDGRAGVEGEGTAAKGEFADGRGGGGAMVFQEFGQLFEAEHDDGLMGWQLKANWRARRDSNARPSA